MENWMPVVYVVVAIGIVVGSTIALFMLIDKITGGRLTDLVDAQDSAWGKLLGFVVYVVCFVVSSVVLLSLTGTEFF